MKTNKLTLAIFVILFKIGTAQQNPFKFEKKQKILISAGSHLGFWYAGGGSNEIPINLTLDYKPYNDITFGIAGSHELYQKNYGDFAGAGLSEGRRVNIRLRLLHLIKVKKNIEHFFGISAGFSRWSNYPHESQKTIHFWPTAQLIYRIQYNFSNDFFWNSELALGPPYACQMAFGVKF